MPRRAKRTPPKRTPTSPLRQSRSQMLPDVVHGLEDQSTAHASLNDSPASAVRSFLPTDTGSTNNTSITSPTDGTIAESIRTSQSVLVADTPIQLEVELTDRAGYNTAETRTVPA